MSWGRSVEIVEGDVKRGEDEEMGGERGGEGGEGAGKVAVSDPVEVNDPITKHPILLVLCACGILEVIMVIHSPLRSSFFYFSEYWYIYSLRIPDWGISLSGKQDGDTCI
jgi:hypothetical protein